MPLAPARRADEHVEMPRIIEGRAYRTAEKIDVVSVAFLGGSPNGPCVRKLPSNPVVKIVDLPAIDGVDVIRTPTVFEKRGDLVGLMKGKIEDWLRVKTAFLDVQVLLEQSRAARSHVGPLRQRATLGMSLART
jgi:hypothetical protein